MCTLDSIRFTYQAGISCNEVLVRYRYQNYSSDALKLVLYAVVGGARYADILGLH